MPNEPTPEELELFHFGIKGMKWGVRRPEGADGTVGSRVRAKQRDDTPESEDSSRARSLKGRSVSSMSNKELSDLNNRLNLEQNYARLTEKPSKLQKGLKYVNTGLTVAQTGRNVYKLKDSPAGKLGAKVIGGALKTATAGNSSSPVPDLKGLFDR